LTFLEIACPMKTSYFLAAFALVLAACGQQQQPAVAPRAITTAAPAPADAPVPPTATDAKPASQK
jgi:hypothetical protein